MTNMTNQREVRVRIWITEPDGREVEVEQAMPVQETWPENPTILHVLESVVGMARRRYIAPAAPGRHVHDWRHGSNMGDPYVVCTVCGTVREVDGNG